MTVMVAAADMARFFAVVAAGSVMLLTALALFLLAGRPLGRSYLGLVTFLAGSTAVGTGLAAAGP
jgi:hypothetical protein